MEPVAVQLPFLSRNGAFAQLAGFPHDREKCVGIGVLVASEERVCILPPTCCGNIFQRVMLAFSRPQIQSLQENSLVLLAPGGEHTLCEVEAFLHFG